MEQELVVDISPEGGFEQLGVEEGQVIYECSDGVTYIKRFGDIKVSTMTLVTILEGNVENLEPVFYVIPVIPASGKYRIGNTYPAAGSISSIRWDGKYRGEYGSYFKNSAFIDIYTKDKKLSTKLSSHKIQMCGAHSLEMGEEASNYILNHISSGFQFLLKVQENLESYIKAVNWILDNSRGDMLITNYPKNLISTMTVYQEQPDNLLVFPPLDYVPEEHQDFAKEIFYRLSDICYVSELRPILEYFTRVDPYSIGKLIGVEKVGRSMVNYNYKLGFWVNRLKLATILKESGFMVEFANAANSYVRVEMISDVPNDQYVIRRDKGNSKQSFLIYTHGNIMHSGPGGEAMSNCYYQLMATLTSIKDQIIVA